MGTSATSTGGNTGSRSSLQSLGSATADALASTSTSGSNSAGLMMRSLRTIFLVGVCLLFAV